MKVLVVGGDSFIGKETAYWLNLQGHHVTTTSRHPDAAVFCDLLDVPALPQADVVYLCAAMTRFIDCEDNRDAYRVNVDAQVQIARQHPWKVIYLSSEAVERALHTTYGMHKALCEIALAPYEPVIVRLSKVKDIVACGRYLASMIDKPRGLYRYEQSSIPAA